MQFVADFIHANMYTQIYALDHIEMAITIKEIHSTRIENIQRSQTVVKTTSTSRVISMCRLDLFIDIGR